MRRLFIILVLFVLFVLSPISIKAACLAQPDRYGSCGTCSCPSGQVGTCSCKKDPYDPKYCLTDTSNCATPAPTKVVASSTPKQPQCTCLSNGGCDGADCQWTFNNCSTSCTSPNNAKFTVKCGSTTCGTNTCGYSASCVDTSCSPNAPGCGVTPVPLDCNYNAYGCNSCGVGRVGKIA
jgi:hypothetical protein